MSLIIKPINDGNSNFSLVELKDSGCTGKKTPHCKIHGAMIKVSKVYWRCIQKEINYLDKTGWHKKVNDCRAGCTEMVSL